MFDWALVVESCPGVVDIAPTGTGLALVYAEPLRTKAAERAKADGQALGVAWGDGLREVTGCLGDHGLVVVRVEDQDQQRASITLRVRRKLTAGLWQKLKLHKRPEDRE